jgi:hypothetical protein
MVCFLLCITVLPIIGLAIISITRRKKKYQSLSRAMTISGVVFSFLTIMWQLAREWTALYSDDPGWTTIVGRFLLVILGMGYIGFGFGSTLVAIIGFPINLLFGSKKDIDGDIGEEMLDTNSPLT